MIPDQLDSPAPLLQMRGIGKAFAGVRVLEGIDFDVRSGEVHVLAGENGAGKSTLMKILAGVHTEYDGEIILDGRTVHFRSPQDAASLGISIIHQELSLIPSMSVADNIFLGREISHGSFVSYRAQRKKTLAALARFGLDVDPAELVDRLPLSVRQMTEIAKALAFEARIIVMDEPTSALTDPEADKLFATIAQLKAEGYGIVYISHKMKEIYQLADRITVLRDGHYIGTADAADLPEAKLINWLVGREISQQFPRHASQIGEVRLQVSELNLPDLSKPGKYLVRNMSFSARRGEILGLAGLQGSGNSELLCALFGAYGKLATGSVKIDGQPFRIMSPRHSVQQGVALLTNDRKEGGLVLCMSVEQNTTLAALPKFSPGGLLRPSAERRAAQASAERLRIRCSSIDQEVGFLSGGNQQKVVLAKWLETAPSILLLDEPTRGVDVGAKHEIYELMNQLSAAGCTILLITSEMPELLAMSDRIIVMHRGETTAEFSREDATQERILAAAMGGTHSGATT